MPRGRQSAVRRKAALAAAAPLGVGEPAGSLSLGARIKIEPAGRSGVLRPGVGRVGNRITVVVDFYNTDTGAVLVPPTVNLVLTDPEGVTRTAIVMSTATGTPTGRFIGSTVPDVSGEWKADILLPTPWSIKLSENFYVNK